MQTIRRGEAGITVRALVEFVAEARAPLRRIGGRLRKRVNLKAPRVFTSNHNCKGVVEAERRLHFEMKTLRVFAFNELVDRGAVLEGSFF